MSKYEILANSLQRAQIKTIERGLKGLELTSNSSSISGILHGFTFWTRVLAADTVELTVTTLQRVVTFRNKIEIIKLSTLGIGKGYFRDL
jgi:hypothetical protein